MAEFAESLNSLKASFPFLEMDQGLELMGQFGELGCNVMDNPSMGLMGFSSGSCLSQQLDFAPPFMDGLLGLLPAECPKPIPGSQPAGSTAGMSHGARKKMKAMAAPETSSGNSSGSPSESMVRGDKTKKRNSPGSGKRGRSKAKEAERPNEVVHVRARRGQATDSHSLAERVRREKINERMRCLQDLVPGCYKTMGMAGTLDEIINYVQSLQNQVEFLSMKLSAASSFYDFSMDDETVVAPQVDDVYEVQEMERLVREGYGVCTSFHSTVPL